MRAKKRKRLEDAGWQFGSTAEFLGLAEDEVALLEMRFRLAGSLRELRLELGLTQVDLAGRIGSSQSRVAKMERADPSVSLELLVRSLLALGKTRAEVGRVIAA